MQYLARVQTKSARAILHGHALRDDPQTRSDAEVFLEMLADKSTQALNKIKHTKISDHSEHALLGQIGVVWSNRDTRQILEQNTGALDDFLTKLHVSRGKLDDCLPLLLQLEYARRYLDPSNPFPDKVDQLTAKKDINRVLNGLTAQIRKPDWLWLKTALKKDTSSNIPEEGSDLGLLFDQIQSAQRALAADLSAQGLARDITSDRSNFYPTVAAKKEVFWNLMRIPNTGTDVADVAGFLVWVDRTSIFIRKEAFDTESNDYGEFLLCLATAPFALTFGGIGLVENFLRGIQVNRQARALNNKIEEMVPIEKRFPDQFDDLSAEIKQVGGAVGDKNAIYDALIRMAAKKEADVRRRKYRTGLSFVALSLSAASAGAAIPLLAVIGGAFGAIKTIDTIHRLGKDAINDVARLRNEETQRITTFAQAGVHEALEIGRFLKVFDFKKHKIELDPKIADQTEITALRELLKYSDWADTFAEKYAVLSKVK